MSNEQESPFAFRDRYGDLTYFGWFWVITIAACSSYLIVSLIIKSYKHHYHLHETDTVFYISDVTRNDNMFRFRIKSRHDKVIDDETVYHFDSPSHVYNVSDSIELIPTFYTRAKELNQILYERWVIVKQTQYDSSKVECSYCSISLEICESTSKDLFPIYLPKGFCQVGDTLIFVNR